MTVTGGTQEHGGRPGLVRVGTRVVAVALAVGAGLLVLIWLAGAEVGGRADGSAAQQYPVVAAYFVVMAVGVLGLFLRWLGMSPAQRRAEGGAVDVQTADPVR